MSKIIRSCLKVEAACPNPYLRSPQAGLGNGVAQPQPHPARWWSDTLNTEKKALEACVISSSRAAHAGHRSTHLRTFPPPRDQHLPAPGHFTLRPLLQQLSLHAVEWLSTNTPRFPFVQMFYIFFGKFVTSFHYIEFILKYFIMFVVIIKRCIYSTGAGGCYYMRRH